MRSAENTDASTSSTSTCELVGHLLVAVDDLVAHGVDDRRRAVGQDAARAPRAQRRASCSSPPCAVPDRDHEVVADEHADLAGLDRVVLVDVPERLEHQEQALVVALELGPLVRRDRVLDGQRVQAERPRRPSASSASVGLVQADPDEVARLASPGRAASARSCDVAVDGDALARCGTARCRRSRGQGRVGSATSARRHGNRDPRAARPDDRQRHRRAGRPRRRASTSTTTGTEQAGRGGERLAAVPLAARGHQPARALPRDRRGDRRRPAGRPRGRDRARADRVRLRRVAGPAAQGAGQGEALATVQAQPSAATFPGGESLPAMQARAVAAVRRRDAAVEAEHGAGAVWVAVTHGDVIKSVLADALGMHLDLFQRIARRPGVGLDRPLHRAPGRSCWR